MKNSPRAQPWTTCLFVTSQGRFRYWTQKPVPIDVLPESFCVRIRTVVLRSVSAISSMEEKPFPRIFLRINGAWQWLVGTSARQRFQDTHHVATTSVGIYVCFELLVLFIDRQSANLSDQNR